MKIISNVNDIQNPYVKRVLTYIIDKDPLDILSTTPTNIKRLIINLDNNQLNVSIETGKWSITETMAHLCDAELAMGFRIRMMLAQSGTPLLAYDQDAWAKQLRYAESDCEEKFTLFTALRRDHVTLLSSLNSEEWEYYGIHAERGKETVERVVQLLAGHDLNHTKQIERIRNFVTEGQPAR